MCPQTLSMRMNHANIIIRVWDSFGDRAPVARFTHTDVVELVHNDRIASCFASLRNSGIIEPVNGQRRSYNSEYYKKGPTVWRFTPHFIRYMQSPTGQRELEAVRQYWKKQEALNEKTYVETKC